MTWLSGTGIDVRLAVRSLLRRPGFTLMAVLTLGLGTGVSTAVFGALDRVILRPLPYANGDRLAYVAIRHVRRGWQFAPQAPVIERWRQGARTVEQLEVYREFAGVRTGEGAAVIVRVVGVSAGLPGMLGVRPLLGRMLGSADAEVGAEPAVMLSERYWRGAYGGDGAVVGRPVRVNDTLFTVVGVWPESARLNHDGSPDLFRMLRREAESPQGGFALVLALLRRGVTVAEVEAELASLARGHDDFSEDTMPIVQPPYGFLGASYVRGLWLVFGGGIVLLCVAIVNAANLMLGRVSGRSSEMGVRLALGGSRIRIARLLLAETTLLAGAGIVVAVGVAAGVGAAFEALEPGRLVPAGAAGLQARMLGFAALLATVAAVVCGVVPLWLVRANAVRTLAAAAGGGRWTAPSTRLRGVLIAMQAALAVLLAAGASLMARSFTQLSAVDAGMDLDRLAVLAVRAPEHRYASDQAQRLFSERVQEALAAIPGVTGVTTATAPPLAASIRAGLPYLDGEEEPVLSGPEFTSTSTAAASYFRVLGIPLLAGRDFEPGERGAVIVNEAFARNRGNVVGRTLRFSRDTLSWTIFGVVGDVRAFGLGDDANRVQLYYPSSGGGAYTRFVLRTDQSPAAALAAARERIALIDPTVPLREARTGPMLVREQTARVRFVASLLAGFALAGLLLAVSGVYGAVSLDISRRTREMGVRLALGASSRRVMTRVLAVGMRPVLAGAIAGVILTLVVAPWLESLLFEVPARDPWSAAAGVTLLAVTAVLGCLVPARRAARVDPAIALRSE